MIDARMLITIAFTGIELFLFVYFIKKKYYNFFAQALIAYLLYLVLLVVEHYYKFHIENFVVVFAMLTALGHALIGQYFDIYNKSKHYDRYLHAFGSFSYALFSYSLIEKTVAPIGSKLNLFFFVTALGISLGVFLEIIEFSQDCVAGTENQKGLVDTNVDLIADVIGSIIAGLLAMSIF